MISACASSGAGADAKADALLNELIQMDEDAGIRWGMVMDLWRFLLSPIAAYLRNSSLYSI